MREASGEKSRGEAAIKVDESLRDSKSSGHGVTGLLCLAAHLAKCAQDNKKFRPSSTSDAAPPHAQRRDSKR